MGVAESNWENTRYSEHSLIILLFACYLKVVHITDEVNGQTELDARLLTPIHTTSLTVSDALFKPGLPE